MVLSVSLLGIASLSGDEKKAGAAGPFCYWMENSSGRFEWVPAEVGGMYRGEGYDRCFALDSCNGGLGESSGGCYKWARASHAPAVRWVQKAPAPKESQR